MKHILYLYILSVLSISFAQKIHSLPNENRFYKIDHDLGFENVMIAFQTDIDLKKISSISFEFYSINDLHRSSSFMPHSKYIKSKSPLTFHNLEFNFPKSGNINRVKIRLNLADNNNITREISILKYEQKNTYRLPINGTWFLSSGHDFGVEHRRHLSRGHFAWDFIIIDENGRPNDGNTLNDNFSVGQDVVAVADGVIINVESSNPDNPPGKVLSKSANYIEIDHGNGEISRYVHLKQHSITVQLGQKVSRGQVIAKVGNSGWSESPHLHIGFQRMITIDGEKKYYPLPIQFSNYIVRWNQGEQIIEKGRPRRGQFVTHQQ